MISLLFNNEFYKFGHRLPKDNAIRIIDCDILTNGEKKGMIEGFLFDFNYIDCRPDDIDVKFMETNKANLLGLFEEIGQKEEFLIAIEEGTTELLDIIDEDERHVFYSQYCLDEFEYCDLLENNYIPWFWCYVEETDEDYRHEYKQIVLITKTSYDLISPKDVIDSLAKNLENFVILPNAQ